MSTSNPADMSKASPDFNSEGVTIELRGYRIRLDAEDVERVTAHTWSVNEVQDRVYFQTRKKVGERKLKMNLGRFLMGAESGYVSQKAGFSRFDYRKEALVLTEMAARQAALPKRKGTCTSIFKGVSRCSRTGLWRASIRPHGLSICLGNFSTEREAARVYNEAARKWYGEKAYINDLSSLDESGPTLLEEFKQVG